MALLGLKDAEVHDYLAGSLENIGADSLIYVVLGSGVSLGLLMRLWPGLLLMTSSEELAHAGCAYSGLRISTHVPTRYRGCHGRSNCRHITNHLAAYHSGFNGAPHCEQPREHGNWRQYNSRAVYAWWSTLSRRYALPLGPAIVALTVVLFFARRERKADCSASENYQLSQIGDD